MDRKCTKISENWLFCQKFGVKSVFGWTKDKQYSTPKPRVYPKTYFWPNQITPNTWFYPKKLPSLFWPWKPRRTEFVFFSRMKPRSKKNWTFKFPGNNKIWNRFVANPKETGDGMRFWGLRVALRSRDPDLEHWNGTFSSCDVTWSIWISHVQIWTLSGG